MTRTRSVFRSLALLLAAAVLPGAVHADLTLAGRNTVSSLGTPAAGQESIFVKGSLARRDALERGKAHTYIYDLKARRLTVLDHSLRVAEVYPMSSLAAGAAETRVAERDLRLELKPTGRSRRLQHWTCSEHTLAVSAPATLGSEQATLIVDGSLWLTARVAEQAEVREFLRAAESPDVFLGLPSLARASPIQAATVSEIIRRVAPKGMPCAADINLRYEGSGRMVELARRFATHLGVSYETFSTRPIDDSAFDIPAGYRIVQR